MTVRRAYASLEEEGFVVGLPGKGVVVTELAPTPQAEAIHRQHSLSDLLRVTVTQAQALGYAPSEIQAAMTRALAEGDGAATILFVGAEPEFIEHYTPLLAGAMTDLDIDVEAISLAKLEATGLRDLRSFPLCVVTLVRSFARVRELLRDVPVAVIALALDLSPETIDGLIRIPRDARVALVAERVNLPGFSHLVHQYVATDEPFTEIVPRAPSPYAAYCHTMSSSTACGRERLWRAPLPRLPPRRTALRAQSHLTRPSPPCDPATIGMGSGRHPAYRERSCDGYRLTGGFARKGKEGHVDDSAKERRRQRMIASRDAGWLSDSMKAAFTTGDARDPIISARFLGDLGEELGGVISLSGGTIGDMLPPDFVREAARNAVEAYPHYPGVKGYRDFRQAIAAKLTRENGIEADPDDEILPTIGGQQVIDSAFRILISPGDDVLLMDPEYASTEPAIRMAGGNVIPVPLQWDGTEWRFDFEELARRASPRTKLLVMSNGNNPTGIVFSREELEQIADLAKPFDFWVFSDEEYEKTLFDGRALQHRHVTRDEGADGLRLLLFEGLRHDRLSHRLRRRARRVHRPPAQHPALFDPGLLRCRAARGPRRPDQRHDPLAAREHRQPRSQARRVWSIA